MESQAKHPILPYALFLLLTLSGLLVDQGSKHLAERRLAARLPGVFAHTIELRVPAESAGETLSSYLRREFRWNTAAEIELIALRHVRDGATASRLEPATRVAAGQRLRVTHREIVVVDGVFALHYARNPGAAFGFLSESDRRFRRPFFIVISLVAMVAIMALLRASRPEQRVMYWGLGLLAGGAVGNLVDRVRLDYVIDFIALWAGGYRLPTFNVADALILSGVSLLLVEAYRDVYRADDDDEEDDGLFGSR